MRALRITALCLLCAPGLAAGDQLSLVVNGLSFHYPRHESFNERNYGYGVQYDKVLAHKQTLLAGAGVFQDSYSTQAHYVGLGWTARTLNLEQLHVDAGAVLLVAASSAYREYYGQQVIAVPLPFVTVGNDRVGLNAMYAPKLGNAYASVVTLQLKVGLF